MSVKKKSSTLAAIVFAMFFPTVLTWVYFVLMANWSAYAQQSAYSVLKFVQFGFPAVWSWCYFRETLPALVPGRQHPELAVASQQAGSKIPGSGWLVSVWFGLFVAASVFAGYWFLSRTGWIEESFVEVVRQRVSGMDIDTPLRFAALGVFYALIHSYLEEYYWRWFVYIRLRDYLPDKMAILVSSLGFMSHHVILLGTFFGWSSPLTWVFSVGVAIGGVVWAWLYRRTGNLLYPWISHLIVDAALFTLGYFLVFGWINHSS